MKNIAIAGAGGIGSNLLAILFDYGYNRKQFDYIDLNIDLYDDDTVDLKNLLHQNFKSGDIGSYKVDVLADKYIVNAKKARMTREDFDKYDLVFSCVDNMPFRKSLYEYSWENPGKIFWIDGRCSSRQAAVFNADISKESLVQWISDSKEEAGCLLAYEKEADISHVTPTIVAGLMAQTFLNKIRGFKTNKHVFII